MRCIALMLVLMLAGCNDPITGGSITGKYTKIKGGLVTDTTHYYLSLKKIDQTGIVEVTQAAWQQAKRGMTWPFEIK